MLEGFIDYSNELGGSYAGSYSRISNLNSQLNQQKRDYEEELKSQAEEIQQLEEALELEEETSDCHLEALEVAKQWRIRQSKEKDDNLERASRKIEMLENIVAWQKYLSGKQLQELNSPQAHEKHPLAYHTSRILDDAIAKSKCLKSNGSLFEWS